MLLGEILGFEQQTNDFLHSLFYSVKVIFLLMSVWHCTEAHKILGVAPLLWNGKSGINWLKLVLLNVLLTCEKCILISPAETIQWVNILRHYTSSQSQVCFLPLFIAPCFNCWWAKCCLSSFICTFWFLLWHFNCLRSVKFKFEFRKIDL